MQGVLLAAGKGTRLQPLTLTRSKAMAPIAGRALGIRVADLLVAQGIDELIVVISPEDEEIQFAFESANLGVPVRFVYQAERKGMAHALGLAVPFLHDDFLMSACDNVVNVSHVAEMVAVHRQHAAAATLSLMPIDIAQASKTGIVEWDAPFVRRIVEKPTPEEAPSNISSLPLYLFSPAVLELLPLVQPSARGEYELQDAIQMLIDRTGRVVGALTDARQQVTTAADLLAMNLEVLHETPTLCVCESPLLPSVRLIPPVRIDAHVEVGAESTIGPCVYIEAGARIGEGASVREALVLRRAEVVAGEQVLGEVIASAQAVASNR